MEPKIGNSNQGLLKTNGQERFGKIYKKNLWVNIP